MYYKTERVGEEEIHLGEKAVAMGLDVVPLTKTEVQALEPKTELDILGAVHYRCDAHLYPNKLIPQLIAYLKAAGVQFKLNSVVEKIITQGGKITKVVTATGEVTGDVFVVAAGSWLSQLTKMAGVSVPLMPGKGYSFTFDKPQQKLNIPAILCEARVAITPMDGRMRYGGTMEIAPINSKINVKRVEGIVDGVHQYFPGIKIEVPAAKDIWYGFRPCTPDGLPYIGFSKKIKNMVIAGGHAMSGLSLGPATGKLVEELVNGKKPSVGLEAFSPERFA